MSSSTEQQQEDEYDTDSLINQQRKSSTSHPVSRSVSYKSEVSIRERLAMFTTANFVLSILLFIYGLSVIAWLITRAAMLHNVLDINVRAIQITNIAIEGLLSIIIIVTAVLGLLASTQAIPAIDSAGRMILSLFHMMGLIMLLLINLTQFIMESASFFMAQYTAIGVVLLVLGVLLTIATCAGCIFTSAYRFHLARTLEDNQFLYMDS